MKADPKLKQLAASPFADMTINQARGDMIDLARINPDLPPSRIALSAAARFVRTTGSIRYPDSVSDIRLCKAVSAFYKREYDVALDPECEIVVVPGTRFGIMAVAAVTAGRDDLIVVPNPGYPDYCASARALDATTAPLPLNQTTFQPDWFAVDSLRPALLFLNYPSNPCGVCAQPATLDAAVAFATSHGCWLAHDLAYGSFCYDGRASSSIFQVPGASSVAVELWSASKTFSLAGWRIGVVVGNAEVVRRVSNFVELHVAAVWPGFQLGLAAALRNGVDDIRERASIYETRRDAFVATIRAADGRVAPADGGLSVWCQAPCGVDSRRMAVEFGLAAAPGEMFGSRGAGWLRLALTVPDQQVPEAARRLARAFSCGP